MNRGILGLLLIFVMVSLLIAADDYKPFNGLNLNLGNLARLSKAQSRSITPENFTGEKGKAGMSVDGPALNAARDLGQGWKVSPYVRIEPKQTFVMADVKGEGAIQQIWLTPAGAWRFAIIRFYQEPHAPFPRLPDKDYLEII